MSLHGQQSKRCGIQKRDKSFVSYRPLLRDVELPAGIDSEMLLPLLKEVRGGDKMAIEEMILGHIRLAISIVNRYIGVYGYIKLADIMDSAAMEGVVVAVNQVAKGKMADHSNVTGYIVTYIHRYIIDTINHHPVVYTPRRKKNKSIESLPDTLSGKDSQLDIQEFEAWDLISSLADSRLEKRILELKRDGHTDSKIGELMGLPRLQILRIRHNLLQRYQKKERSHV